MIFLLDSAIPVAPLTIQTIQLLFSHPFVPPYHLGQHPSQA